MNKKEISRENRTLGKYQQSRTGSKKREDMEYQINAEKEREEYMSTSYNNRTKRKERKRKKKI